MAHVVESKKACSVNPLKMSQPLGASLAFLGLDSCMPVMHGSQGCTSFGLVLLVRHFKEAIPLQTTAMNEVTSIMGGYDNIEAALLNIHKRANPKVIAICSTGLTETKGDDVDGYIVTVRKREPELADTEIVYVSTPDYVGGFEDGYAHAVTAIVKTLVKPLPVRADQVTLIPGSHLTPGDIDELREIIESFGLRAIVVPDISGSLDGHIPPDWRGTTIGGTTLDGHFYTGGVKVAIAAEPDLLLAVGSLLHEMGAELRTCIRTTKSASHARLPAEQVMLGDLEDLEKGAADCDLLITHAHGRQAAERVYKPLLRIGIPVFDRIGNAYKRKVSYRGTWESKSDLELLKPYIRTAEERRALPILGDPDPETLWHLEIFYNAIVVTIERETGQMVSPMMKMSHEGFGRMVLIAGRLVVVNKQLRDVHRFGFPSLAKLASAGGKFFDEAVTMIRTYPEEIKARLKKLNARATQAKMDLHDLSEELPTHWESILTVAQRCHEAHAMLMEARRAAAAL